MKIVVIALLGFALVQEEGRPQGAERAAAAESAVREAYEKLLERDEAALRAIEKIFEDENRFAQAGTPNSREVIQAKLNRVVEPAVEAYEEFLKKHPEHVDALIAYASFLGELGDEAAAIPHLEKARRLAPKNPTPWNNLANIYGHIGPVRKAFHYYEKAIELNPKEPVYLRNLATTTYLFRKDAREMYRISEQEVFDKALELYRRALELDPDNFVLAADLAQSYYGIQPRRVDEAIAAWERALKVAKGELERQGVYTHLARFQLGSGRFKEAAANLAKVTHPDLQDLKERLERNLEREKSEAAAEEEAD